MSNTITPPQTPKGDGQTGVSESGREHKRSQLTPETPGQSPKPEGSAAKPHPEPPPPAQHHEDPEPQPVPDSARKQLPEAKYGKGDPVNPPPETLKP